MVSVILPNYNHKPFLKQRLDSIFNQTHQNFEVIILDDASTDSSVSFLNKYKNHPKVSHFIVNKENSGSPFKQWEKGLQLAKGDFIWIAESDDFCELNFLESHLKFMENSAMCVAQTLYYKDQKVGKEVAHPAFKNMPNVELNQSHLLHCPVLNVSAAVFKKIDTKKLEQSTFADYSIIGDRVFYHEFFFNKGLLYNSDTQSYFRQENDNLSNLESKGLDYLIRYFKEHVRFINHASKENIDVKEIRKNYIRRFYARVRDRVSRKNKISWPYFKLYLYYHFQLLKT